jgi:TRAP-type C4-dicarboxylate transport system substrate-binding protein
MKKLAFASAAPRWLRRRLRPDQVGPAHRLQCNSFQTQNVQQFAADVDQGSGGKLKITLHPGGSLYKANEIKRAVQTGQVPAAEFILSGAANENPLFGVDSIPFLATSYGGEAPVPGRQAGAGQAARRQGMKVLFSVPWPGQSLYSQQAHQRARRLQGHQDARLQPGHHAHCAAAQGPARDHPAGRAGPGPGHGRVQNFLTSSASGVESKLHEQVKYFYPVNAWLPRNATVVSQKAFDALDKPPRTLCSRPPPPPKPRGWATSERLDGEYIKELGQGHEGRPRLPTRLKKELRKIGETMTAEWLKHRRPEGQAVIDAYRKP